MAGELTSYWLARGVGLVQGAGGPPVDPTLNALTVSPSSATVGTPYNGTVSGKTSGSTLSLTGAGAAGLSVVGATISGTPTTSGAVNIVETLAGATNTPRTSNGVVTVAAADTPLRVASTENRMATGREGRSMTGCLVRWQHFLGGDFKTMLMSFYNYYNQNGEIISGNDFTIEEAAFQNADGTKTIKVTFDGGQASKVISAGANDIQCDPVPSSAFQLAQFSRGEQYWTKFRVSVPTTAGTLPFTDRNRTSFSGAQVSWYDPAVTTPAAIDAPGAWTSTGVAQDVRQSTVCPVILGEPVNDATLKSSIAVGNSIGSITGDTSNAQGRMGVGFIHRAMHDANALTNPLPCINFCRVGNAHNAYTGTNTRWRAYIKYAKFAIDELGTNTIGTTNSSGWTQGMKDLATEIWSIFRAGGIAKIIRTKLLPRTDAANTTPNAGWGTGEARDQANAYFDAKQADGTVDIVVPMSSLRNALNQNLWSDTAGVPDETDGTHPNSSGHEKMAVELRVALAAV